MVNIGSTADNQGLEMYGSVKQHENNCRSEVMVLLLWSLVPFLRLDGNEEHRELLLHERSPSSLVQLVRSLSVFGRFTFSLSFLVFVFRQLVNILI